MKHVRVLLVDDERLARARLRRLVERDDRIDVRAEAGSVQEAIDILNREEIDLIFLDIQMPGGGGFHLLQEWKGNACVVFVTAFDSFAVRAFEVNAIDYLVKPVRLRRAQAAIDRTVGHLSRRQTSTHSARRAQITLRTRAGMRVVPIDEIVSIHSADDYTEVIDTTGRVELSTTPLSAWEEELKTSGFCRIHRQSLINLRHIQQLERLGDRWQVKLSARTTPLRVGRRRLAHLKASLQTRGFHG